MIEIQLSKNRWVSPVYFYLGLPVPNKDLYKIY